MKYQEEQQIQIIEEPIPEPPFWQSEWMWTGVVVPIVLAWIMHKRHKHKDE